MAVAAMPDVTTNPMAMANFAAAYGPQAQIAMRRSQYLADALRQMSAEGGQNIRSPAELGSKLLAMAILQRGNDRSQDALIQALTADRSQQDAFVKSGTPLDPAYDPGMSGPGSLGAQPPAASLAPPSPQSQPPPLAPVQSPSPPPATPAPPNGATPALASVSPQDRDTLARMVAAEAGGESPVGQAAAAHVALNRLRSGYGGARSLSDVVNAPGQFEGMGRAQSLDPNALAGPQRIVDAVLGGQIPDPTNGAVNFLNPQLQTQLGRAIPPWAQGPGQRIGNHVFFGGAPAPNAQAMADAAMQAHQAPPGTLMGGGNPGHPGQDPLQAAGFSQPSQPYQVAANGPTPPPPQPQAAPSGPSPTPMAAGPPRQIVTPQEWALAGQLMSNYHTHDQGLALLLQLKQRAASPVAMKPGTYFDAQGQPHAVEQFIDQPGSPNATVQRSSLDNHITSTPNAAYGAVGPGMVMGPTGQVSQVPIQQNARYRIPGALGIYSDGPDGKPVKVADDAITPKDLQTSRDSWRTSDDVKKANEGIAAYNGLAGAISKMADNNGVISTASVDSYLRGINPGMGARNATVNMFLTHMGWPTELKSFIQSNIPGGGGGYITGPTMQYMLSTIRSYAGAHSQIAQGMADRDLKALNGYGVPVTPEMLGEALTPFAPPPHATWLDGQGAAAPGPSAPGAQLGSQATPKRPQSQADFDHGVAVGEWFVNPADGRVLQKQH